jgi:hypothetical protein
MSHELHDRLRKLIKNGRDEGMKTDLVEEALIAIMDAQREADKHRAIAERFGLVLERIAYNDAVHEGAEDPEYWPCNVARSVLQSVDGG